MEKYLEKYLLDIEFRYNDAPRYPDGSTYQNKTVTIGIYETYPEACKVGNELMEKMEGKFNLHTFLNGSKARKERFSERGGPFGSKLDLISNLAYLKTPFAFYAKITTLKFDDIDNTISDVIAATKRYNKYKREEEVE